MVVVDIVEVEVGDSRLQQLMAALEVELAERYGVTDPGARPTSPLCCLLALQDGEAVGCVPLVAAGPGAATLTRMYVIPERRGRRLSANLLEAAERRAAQSGHHDLRLHTGTEQASALSLYERAGWVRVPCTGTAAQDPASVCLAKQVRSL